MFDGLAEGNILDDDSLGNSLGPIHSESHIGDPFDILDKEKVCVPTMSTHIDQIQFNIEEERYFSKIIIEEPCLYD